MPEHSWDYVPPPGQRVRRQAIGVERQGRRWSGSWTVEGDILHVESAYGSRAAPAGAEHTREARATKLLGEIVDTRPRS